jgi:hypothetical protein
MPSKQFTGIDLINYNPQDLSSEVISFGSGSGSGGTSPTFTSPGVASASGAASGFTDPGPPDGNFTLSMISQLVLEGDLDLSLAPIIPANAIISDIDVQVEYSAFASGQYTFQPVTSQLASASVQLAILLGANLCADLVVNEGESNSWDGTQTVTGTGSKNLSDHHIFSGLSISRDNFETDYSHITISSTAASGGGAASSPDVAGGSISTVIQLENFRITVTYTSEDTTFSVTPPSGDVEEGQQVTVEGPVEDLEFAFLIGDKVVPVIPKKISPTEVLIEVPAPPSDPCIASIAACPECEDCFTVCEEDLTSEECQACLETCFQCLENELESTEAAEECQQSSQEPPEIPAVLICGDPGTQFTGSVPLGDFTIIVANGSGLYRLVAGKTNDTLYQAARDGTTYDVKIPNPGGKTGFFRG